MKPDIQDIFVNWKQKCQTDFGKTRYSSLIRKEVIDILVDMLVEMSIDYDEAKNLKNQVTKILITKEGLVGAGKYKGWKQAVEDDFLSSLFEAYDSKNLFTKTPSITPKPQQPAIKNHPLIDAWGKQKFGELWDNSMIMMANLPDSSLHNLFLDEYFGDGSHMEQK
jgi:hypothetical protein